jgi:hypothetical protein
METPLEIGYLIFQRLLVAGRGSHRGDTENAPVTRHDMVAWRYFRT